MISICPILLPLLFSNCFINNFLSSCLCWFWIQCPNSGFSLFKSHLFASWWSWNLQCSTCQPFPASLDTMSYFLTFQFYSSLHALSFVSNCFNSKNILYSVLYLLTHFPNCRFSLYTFESLFASKIRLQLFKIAWSIFVDNLVPWSLLLSLSTVLETCNFQTCHCIIGHAHFFTFSVLLFAVNEMISICPILLLLLFSNCFNNNFLWSCLWFWTQCHSSGFSSFLPGTFEWLFTSKHAFNFEILHIACSIFVHDFFLASCSEEYGFGGRRLVLCQLLNHHRQHELTQQHSRYLSLWYYSWYWSWCQS